jgi:hypothetical protein
MNIEHVYIVFQKKGTFKKCNWNVKDTPFSRKENFIYVFFEKHNCRLGPHLLHNTHVLVPLPP